MSVTVEFTCNGRRASVETAPDRTLADVLREQLGLTGTKIGCGTGDCGTCTVLVDNEVVCSCLTLASRCGGRDVQTIEGVVNTELGALIVEEFALNHAVQCGICSPGLVVAAANLIEQEGGGLERAQVDTGLAGNLCRCTGYQAIVSAVLSASQRWHDGAGGTE
jgi:aerobic-type carbon monoxide dehydrogenase small subunit (CoxS/CutS family)